MTDDIIDFRRLREAWRRYEELIALGAGRTAAQNEQLREAATFIAEFYAPRPYDRQLGSWPDARE